MLSSSWLLISSEGNQFMKNVTYLKYFDFKAGVNPETNERGHNVDKKRYKCDECGKGFLNNRRLSDHTNVHTGEKPYKCKFCSSCFAILETHRRHERGHDVDQKRNKCDRCGKGFSTKRLLSDHTNVHTGEKPYKCKFCSSCFASQKNHRIHERGHTDDQKKFRCDICGKGFLLNWLLSDHTNVHTGKKPYKCKSCSKCFASLGTRDAHERGHTEKFRCDKCGKGFSNNSLLSDHTNVHNGEKPYKCKFCSSCFSGQKTLRLHERGHTDDQKKFRCDSCDKGFLNNSLLSNHIKNVHTGEKP